MYYSPHALKRMAQRNITKPMVLAVLIHGEPKEAATHKGTRYELNGLNVVTCQAGKNDIVITVYEKWNKKNRRKKKRRGFKNRKEERMMNG